MTARVKALLRARFAGFLHDEYLRVTADNVVLRRQNALYKTALGEATVDLQEATRDRVRAEQRASESEQALTQLQGVHARVLRQRDNAHTLWVASAKRLRDLGEVDVVMPEEAK